MATRLAKLSAIPDGHVEAFQADSKSIAVANVGGRLYAFDNVCTHLGCLLSDGPLGGNIVTCPCHSSQFDVTTGAVVAGPATTPVESYRVQVEGDEIVLFMSEDTPAAHRPSALAAVPLLSCLDAGSLAALEEFSFRRTFQPGELIVEEGRTGNGLYVVLSGRVEVVKGLGGERPQTAAILGPGEPFGEMALLGDWKRSASVRVVDEAECLGIDRWAFLAHLSKDPRLAIKLLQLLAQRLAETNARLAE